MIVVKIIGGLGNQMFQYAFGYTLAKKKKTTLELDVSDYKFYDNRKYELDLFNINNKFASKNKCSLLKYGYKDLLFKLIHSLFKIQKKNSNSYYIEQQFQFNSDVFEFNTPGYYEGYWQSEKYFNCFSDDIREIFKFSHNNHLEVLKFKNKILNSNSVSIHVRRGDYLDNKQINSIHGVCGLDYYRKSVDYMKSRIIDPSYFVFSDDIDWAKKNFNFIDTCTFVDLNDSACDFDEMFLMTICKHNIIANSSFSWWGAWLNKNQRKIVIAPKKWFTDSTIDTSDLIPKSWFRL